uniref:Ubiquitin-like protease family profile domain-containing protein n=1 Tax=Brassica oleracea TaxID=3712 RepID=A0A3P6E9C6_BRAOL|nr:unnamed protein product [Brassica oleracea]
MTSKSVLRRSRKRWLSSSKRCHRFRQQWGKTKTNHHRVCVLQQQRKKAKARLMRVWFLLRFVVALGKEERICHNHLPMGNLHKKKKKMGTQEYLQDTLGNLSQVSHVKGFDPSQKTSDEEAPKWVTPLSSFKPGDWRTPTLKDMELPEDRVNDEDYSLVFVPEDSWAKLIHWCSTTKQHLKIGPSMYTTELAERVMGPAVWLNNHFKKDRKKFRVEGLLHQYGIGELPAHGLTRLVWDLDVNRMFLTVGGLKHNKDLEPFAHLIPRIVKAVQSSEKRGFIVKPYDVTYAPMPLFLNKTSSDCGVYALKHLEAHLLGMDLTLVNDDNIREARQKIAYDLWEAANDPELISRMGKFIPRKATTSPTVEIL